MLLNPIWNLSRGSGLVYYISLTFVEDFNHYNGLIILIID